MGDAINVNQEKARLQKDIQKADNEIVKLEKKLSNHNFISKAPKKLYQKIEIDLKLK